MSETRERKLAPWIHGIIETMAGALLLHESGFPQRNRLAVFLLDSALETSIRAFLRYKARVKLTDAHKHRANLISIAKSKLAGIDDEVWDTLDYYYQEVRCDLYHESAGKTITDDSFLDYKESVEFVVDRMLDVRSESLARAQCRQATAALGAAQATEQDLAVELHDLEDPVAKVIVAVASLAPKKVDEVNEFFRRAGDSFRLDSKDFTNILARNSGSKRFFYHNKETKVWQLSGLGEYQLSQLRQGVDDE